MNKRKDKDGYKRLPMMKCWDGIELDMGGKDRMSKDIGVYTTREKLIHKIGESGLECLVYWYLKNPPKDGTIRRVYFACDGYWAGYFICYGIDPDSLGLSEWHQIDPREHACKQFQGFTYNTPDAD